MNQTLLQWLATVTALVGSWLLALNCPGLFTWGFVAFIASNFMWIGWGFAEQAWGLVLQNIGFTSIAVFGALTWFAMCDSGPLTRIRLDESRLVSELKVAYSTVKVRLSLRASLHDRKRLRRSFYFLLGPQ